MNCLTALKMGYAKWGNAPSEQATVGVDARSITVFGTLVFVVTDSGSYYAVPVGRCLKLIPAAHTMHTLGLVDG